MLYVFNNLSNSIPLQPTSKTNNLRGLEKSGPNMDPNSMKTDRCVIPLDRAWFCESCCAVSNDAHCSNCDSAAHTDRLAKWLDPAIIIPGSGVWLSISPAPKEKTR